MCCILLEQASDTAPFFSIIVAAHFSAIFYRESMFFHLFLKTQPFNWRCFDLEIDDMDEQRIDKVIVKLTNEIREEMED